MRPKGASRRMHGEMKRSVYRHPLAVRITHWVVFLSIVVLAMSGMQIFNAHPALYASDASVFRRPVLAINAALDPRTGQPVGYVQIGEHRIVTTHVLGYASDGLGGEAPRAFPGWATIPGYQDLADGRRWHFLFAWIFGLCAIVYAGWAFQLLPKASDLKAIPATLKQHLVPWRVPAHASYNPLQKITYFGLVFVVAPLVILTGLALSPAVDAHAHWLPALFGGRQFARIWHFAAMLAFIAFFIAHVAMVALTGFWNNLRSMITGWFDVEGRT